MRDLVVRARGGDREAFSELVAQSLGRLTAVARMLGVFELLRLGPGHAWDEFSDHVAEEQHRAEADEPPLGPPSWVSEITRQELDGRGTAALEASLKSGSYVLVCSLIGDPEPNPIASIFAIGPIEVAP